MCVWVGRAAAVAVARAFSTGGVPFDAVVATVTMLPYTTAHEIILTGRALAPGRLEIRGVRLAVFGIEREHVGRVARPGETAGAAATGTAAGAAGGTGAGARTPRRDSKAKPMAAGDAAALSLHVIEDMPQLQVHDAHLFATPLQLWEGERYGAGVGPLTAQRARAQL